MPRKIILVIVCLLSSVGPLNAQVRSLFEPPVPNEISIYTVGRDTKKYWNMVANASSDNSLTIRDKYKKKVSANIQFKNTLGQNIFSTAKIRITGDWKDHLDMSRVISSLNVDLKNENIGNIVKFRLLLPRTRNGANEILWSILMEELGYPVPFRKLITVKLNGNTSYEAIFEEAAEKEFLERYGFRESPIIESDERQHWANVAWRTDQENCLDKNLDSGECLINDWSRYESYKVDNASFVKNEASVRIAMKAFNIETVLGEGYDAINKVYAAHGLDEHNRKRIYDPMYGVHFPVYVDGDVVLPKCDVPVSSEVTGWEQVTLDRIGWKYRVRTGAALPDHFQCTALNVLRMTEPLELPEAIKLHEMSYRDFYAFQPLTAFPSVRPEIVGFNPTEGRVESCQVASIDERSLQDCYPVNFGDKRKYVVGGGEPIQTGMYDVYPAVVGKLIDQRVEDQTQKSVVLDALTRELSVPENTTIFVKLMPDHSDLEIVFEHPSTSRVVIYQSKLSPLLNIYASIPEVEGEQIDDESEARYDEHLLTSCLTFMDTEFSGGRIHVQGGGCEDSVNFIRATGFLSEVVVENALSDALDADFSRLDFKNVMVTNAGNDCLDLSAGYYNLATATLSDCGDKALSAGERARVAAGTIEIRNSPVGLASKDTSKLHVTSVKSDGSSAAACLSAYRKKQEFNAAELIVADATLCETLDFDSGSTIGTNVAFPCLYFSEMNGYEICVTRNGIDFGAAYDRPHLYDLNVKWMSSTDSQKTVAGPSLSPREKCGNIFPCEFNIKWNDVQGFVSIKETNEKNLILSETSLDLARLGYAERN
jgi:hypothetical protein